MERRRAPFEEKIISFKCTMTLQMIRWWSLYAWALRRRWWACTWWAEAAMRCSRCQLGLGLGILNNWISTLLVMVIGIIFEKVNFSLVLSLGATIFVPQFLWLGHDMNITLSNKYLVQMIPIIVLVIIGAKITCCKTSLAIELSTRASVWLWRWVPPRRTLTTAWPYTPPLGNPFWWTHLLKWICNTPHLKVIHFDKVTH